MKLCSSLSTLLLCVPGIVCATTEQSVYQQLLDGLQAQNRILSTITDKETARVALPELKQTMATLKALNSQVDENDFWNYLENTPDVKQPLLDEMETLFGELQRLEKANFFGSQPLRNQLEPLIIPAA